MNETAHMLDFDWADTENTAEYPPELKYELTLQLAPRC